MIGRVKRLSGNFLLALDFGRWFANVGVAGLSRFLACHLMRPIAQNQRKRNSTSESSDNVEL
jgi:hypothetical protein